MLKAAHLNQKRAIIRNKSPIKTRLIAKRGQNILLVKVRNTKQARQIFNLALPVADMLTRRSGRVKIYSSRKKELIKLMHKINNLERRKKL